MQNQHPERLNKKQSYCEITHSKRTVPINNLRTA